MSEESKGAPDGSSSPVQAAQQDKASRKALIQRLKIAAAAIFGALFLAFTGLVVYLKTLDFNSYIPLIQQEVQKATGRTLSIDGRMDVIVSLHPSLKVQGVHLSNAPGASRARMMDVERMEIEISLLPLLSGELLVEHVTLIRPDILFEKLADGSDNWTFNGESVDVAASTTAEASAGSPGMLPRVSRLIIKDAKMGFRDAADGKLHSLDIPELELWEGNVSGDNRLHLRTYGTFDKLPLKLQGSIAPVHALLDNQPLNVALHAMLPGVDVKMTGSVSKPLDGSGMALDIELDSPGIGSLAKLMKLPPLLALAMHVKTGLKDDAEGFQLHGMKAKIGDNDVAGDVHLGMPNGRMRVDAILNSDNISLIGLLPGGTGTKVAGAKPVQAKPMQDKQAALSTAASKDKKNAVRLLPAQPLNFALLRQMDVAIEWKMKRFAMPDLQLSDVLMKLRLDRGELGLSPFRAKLAGGEMNATLVLKAQKSPAVLGMSASGRKIMADQLLAMRVGKGDAPMMQGGSLDFDLGLDGRGMSVAELMAGSNGRIKLQMGEGKIKSTALDVVGGDMLMSLADKLNPFSDKTEYMELKCGVVHFRVQDGMMLTEDGIAFETARVNILSEGKINWHNESTDLSFGTEPREGIGLNLLNMVNVVKLGGTLAEPGLVVDAGKTGMAAARTASALMTGGLSLLGEG
ncbi:MAG: AsmA family protein, partial [Mariprofundaceae bacterium]|nr:AsmA family protein [Mariprofundaceae bacterium]